MRLNNQINQSNMKARLKEESQLVTRLSEMKEQQFAVILDGELDGHIVYRPIIETQIFAIDLTDGEIWSDPPESKNFKVRILQAGEVIEITE